MNRILIIIIIILIVIFILTSFTRMNKLKKPVDKFEIRGCDKSGCGHYLADRGHRKHLGIDVITTKGQIIKSPITGVLRRLYPYTTAPNITGYAIKKGKLEVKIFYVNWLNSLENGTLVKEGETIGTAQDIAGFYKDSNMTNHIHVEVWENGKNMDPTPYFL